MWGLPEGFQVPCWYLLVMNMKQSSTQDQVLTRNAKMFALSNCEGTACAFVAQSSLSTRGVSCNACCVRVL